MNLVVYGDQLIASPGPYEGFNVPEGDHWWQLLAKHRGYDSARTLFTPTQSIGIGPLYYTSQILKTELKEDDYFVSIMPSWERHLGWDDKEGPIHEVSIKPGIHHIHEYKEWQKDLMIRTLSEWAKDKKCFFIITEVTQEKYNWLDPNKFVVLADLKEPGRKMDMNFLWMYVMLKHPVLSHPGHFYKQCAPDRKLNEWGNRCVFEVLAQIIP